MSGIEPASAPAPRLWGLSRRAARRVGAVLALLTLVGVGAETGARGLAIGLPLAMLPVPVYGALVLWLDRFEQEPRWMLAQAFGWGAIVAPFFSMVLNGAALAAAVERADPETAEIVAAVLTAPVVEELAKGLALILLCRAHRDEFDNVTDGVVYAAMVGLGFAMTENVLYYGRAAGDGTLSGVLVLRGLIAPFSHPLFTAATGVGLGIRRERRRGAARTLAPIAGLATAIALHFLWNLSATLGVFRAVYLSVMLPSLTCVLWLVGRSLKREARVLREHLRPLVAAGVLPAAELERLCSPAARTRAWWRALLLRGPDAARRRRQLNQFAAELAFHYWRVGRGISLGETADSRRELEYLQRIREALEA